MKTKRKIILSTVSLFALLLLLTAIVQFEPFAPRFKGRTANQWLNYYSKQKNLGQRYDKVVEAFGTNLLTTLLAHKDPPFWLSAANKFNALFPGRFHFGAEASAKWHLTRQWAHLVVQQNPQLEREFLKDSSDDKFLLSYFELTCWPGDLPDRLRLHVLDTNQVVQKRMEYLLKEYRHWDDKKFARWLKDQRKAASQITLDRDAYSTFRAVMDNDPALLFLPEL